MKKTIEKNIGAIWNKRGMSIDSKNRTNLEAKSKKCVFVGYGINEFGYRLWDFENHKIVRSQNVIFNEKVLYKDLLQ